MSVAFLFIADPLETLNIALDTTLAIMEESSARGVYNYFCETKDIVIKDGRAHFLCAPVFLERNYQQAPRVHGAPQLLSADHFQAIFMRKDPPVDEAFFTALLMLRHYDPKKTLMINDADGVLRANEKLFGLDIAEDLFAKTIVSAQFSVITDFIEDHHRVVLKPLFASGGAGVMIMEKDDRNLSSALELLTHGFTRPIMVQAYISNARAGDKRIIILGGQALGAIMRVPAERDHRANFHAGGQAQATTLSIRDLEIVQRLRPHLSAFGLHLVGIDVINGFLTEINVTSPTCIIHIEQMSKPLIPLRQQIIDYVLAQMPQASTLA